ncbi:MAG: hypothetical protein H6742_03380 [Alphaproteobacteria bacterium]|nr:hypothetical protein [Alphaproteobacteria bacterium]
MTRTLLFLAGSLLPLSMACGRGGPPEGEEGSGGGDTGGTTGDTGISAVLGIQGLRGDATVADAYSGAETLYYQDAETSTDWCTITSDVTSVDLAVPACDSCEWSFTLQTSGSAASGCGAVDATAFDGVMFHYAFAAGEDGYGTLAYYYEGGGWYGSYATASFDAGAFTYDWPIAYFYEYGQFE